MYDAIRDLIAIPAISGNEHAVRRYISEQLKDAPAVSDIQVDRLGNCLVSLKGRQPAKQRVVFAAHMDEVGGIVTHITDDGYLRFETVGGICDDVLFGKRVYVNGYPGVIGGKAVHRCKGDDKNRVPSVSGMLIDIGAACAEQARTVVREGDAITFATDWDDLSNTAFCAKALDDRVGCALLLQLAKIEPEYDIILAFTVQEELGCRGAMTAAFALQPDVAIAVDVTTASDLPDVSAENQVACFKKGPVVSFMDRGTMYDPDLYRHIRLLAAEHNIPTQTKTKVAGANDAQSFQRAGAGARVAAVSLPCRYLHAPSCVLCREDVDNALRLLRVLATCLPAEEATV